MVMNSPFGGADAYALDALRRKEEEEKAKWFNNRNARAAQRERARFEKNTREVAPPPMQTGLPMGGPGSFAPGSNVMPNNFSPNLTPGQRTFSHGMDPITGKPLHVPPMTNDPRGGNQVNVGSTGHLGEVPPMDYSTMSNEQLAALVSQGDKLALGELRARQTGTNVVTGETGSAYPSITNEGLVPGGGPGTFTPGSFPGQPESVISQGGPGTFAQGGLPPRPDSVISEGGPVTFSPSGFAGATGTPPNVLKDEWTEEDGLIHKPSGVPFTDLDDQQLEAIAKNNDADAIVAQRILKDRAAVEANKLRLDMQAKIGAGEKLSETELRALENLVDDETYYDDCLLYTSPSPRDRQKSRMPSSA